MSHSKSFCVVVGERDGTVLASEPLKKRKYSERQLKRSSVIILMQAKHSKALEAQKTKKDVSFSKK